MILTSAGDFGIGTTTPSATLDVNGNANVGNLNVNGNINAAGSADVVSLKTVFASLRPSAPSTDDIRIKVLTTISSSCNAACGGTVGPSAGGVCIAAFDSTTTNVMCSTVPSASTYHCVCVDRLA